MKLSKELTPLEALDKIRDICRWNTTLYPAYYVDELDLIETALNEKTNIENRLDEIFENHNIKSFTELNERLCDYNELKFDDDIKQNKLKALEIIKKKDVDIVKLKFSKKPIEYNIDFEDVGCLYYRLLTQKEFDLLKEVLL